MIMDRCASHHSMILALCLSSSLPRIAAPAPAQMQLVVQGEGGPQELPQLMWNWSTWLGIVVHSWLGLQSLKLVMKHGNNNNDQVSNKERKTKKRNLT